MRSSFVKFLAVCQNKITFECRFEEGLETLAFVFGLDAIACRCGARRSPLFPTSNNALHGVFHYTKNTNS